MVVSPQAGSDNWSVTAEFFVLGVRCEPDESGAQNSNCPIVLPPTWNIPISAAGSGPQEPWSRAHMVGVIKSWACPESHCLMAVLLTSTEWESYLPDGLRVAKFCGTLHVTQVRVLNQPYDFCMHMSGCDECSYEGILSTLFFPTESLTEPGGH